MTTTYPAEAPATTASTSSKRAPKHLYRLAETALAAVVAPSEERLLRAIAERVQEHFGETCGVRAWAIVSNPFELDARQGDAALAARIAEHRDPEIVVWELHGEREWRVGFRLSQTPDETAQLLLHLSKLAAQQRLTETGWSTLLDRARAIQQSLLPKPPLRSLPGFDVHGRSDSAAVVGGDVFDVQPITSDSSSLLLGDASGHGLPAALQARDVVIGLRMGHENHLKIDSTMEKLNRVLCSSTLSSQFVSLVYGEIDGDGAFQYVNAGHPSPLIVTREAIELLPQTGPVLGVSPASRFRVAHAVLPPSSVLVLYSDGVVECPALDGEEFSVERLAATVLEHLDAPAERIANAIFEAMARHRGRNIVADDATVLIAQRKAR